LTDDKLFQTLVSRVSSRETAFLTLTAIASSASLLLLGLFFIIKNEYSIHILILGVLFPSLSLVYTEITLNTIHKHDWMWIRKIVKENNDSKKDTEAILAYKEHRVVRRVLTKLIFSLPYLAGHLFIQNFGSMRC